MTRLINLTRSSQPRAKDSMTNDEHAVHAAARRLVDTLQMLVPRNPGLAQAIDQCVVALVAEDLRQRVIANVARLTAEDLAAVEALTTHLLRQHDATRPDDPDDAA